jgi:hypothetical protein
MLLFPVVVCDGHASRTGSSSPPLADLPTLPGARAAVAAAASTAYQIKRDGSQREHIEMEMAARARKKLHGQTHTGMTRPAIVVTLSTATFDHTFHRTR